VLTLAPYRHFKKFSIGVKRIRDDASWWIGVRHGFDGAGGKNRKLESEDSRVQRKVPAMSGQAQGVPQPKAKARV